MSVLDCCQPCGTVQVTETPGPQGDDGSNGVDGVNAFSFVADPGFTIPAVGVTVGVALDTNKWMVIGQIVVVDGPATFQVVSLSGDTGATLKFLGYFGDLPPTTAMAVGLKVSPAGVGFSNPVPVAQGGTGATTATGAAKALTTIYRLLGKLLAANMNSTADQVIAINSANYIVRRIICSNASISLTTAAGGIYVGAAKTGVVIVPAAQVYSALTAAAKFKDLTLDATAGGPTTDRMTAPILYLSLTTAQGAAATADVCIFGEDLS